MERKVKENKFKKNGTSHMKKQYNNIENNLKKGLCVVVKDLSVNSYRSILNHKDINGNYRTSDWRDSIEASKQWIGDYCGDSKEDWDHMDLEIVEVFRPEEKLFEVGDEVRISDKIKETDDWDFYKDSFPEMKGKIGEVYNNILGRYYKVNGWNIGQEYLIPLIEDDEVEKAIKLLEERGRLKDGKILK